MKSRSVFLAILLFAGIVANLYCQVPPTRDVSITHTNNQNRIPVDMFYKSSLSQFIYRAVDINMYEGSTIEEITFFNNFRSSLYNKPTKIWLANTDLLIHQTNWVPASQMTLVFDGTVNYPSGENSIQINLQQHFVYGGQNLMVMVYRPLDTDYYFGNDYFLCSNYGNYDSWGRSRVIRRDSEINPDAPSGGSYDNYVPNVRFKMRFPVVSAAPQSTHFNLSDAKWQQHTS